MKIMHLQKLILISLIALVLGQSVLASADVHFDFSTTDTHHLQHDLDDLSGEIDHSGSNCGHCCHSHGCNLSLTSFFQVFHTELNNKFDAWYLRPHYFHHSDPALRPPIA